MILVFGDTFPIGKRLLSKPLIVVKVSYDSIIYALL